MGQKTTEDPAWRTRIAGGVGLAIAAAALEATAWGALQRLGVQRVAEVLLIGSAALLATVCVFVPTRWLRHPEIAGPAADSPRLVRAICAGGGGLLWALAYMMTTAP